ncbi:MAG: class I SAM-dependent methyltransferase [Acidobacteriota bacterium]
MFPREALRFVLLASLAIALTDPMLAPAAQLEWRDAKDWIVSLERPERLAELQVEKRLAPLELKPGDIVADIGAGTGVFSRAMARAVGPTGRVYAEEIQQALVDYIDMRSEQENIDNITTVLGDFDDPKLPTRDVDVAWFHDVLHAVEHKESLLKALVSYMKPKSRIAITDWVKSDRNALKYHDDLEILLSRDEVKKLLAAVGFYPVQDIDGYSLSGIKQWYLIFERRAGS